MTDEKVRENRLRRVAERRGLRIEKSRRRDREALTFGRYWVLRPNGKDIVDDIPELFPDAQREHTVTLDQIEAAFTKPKAKR